MKLRKIGPHIAGALGVGLALATASISPAQAQAPAQAPAQKPNILFVMTDDVGWMTPGVYHRGLMVGETPNIDRIGQEGVMFLDAYSEQSCTAGRNAFMTGMNPLRTGLIVPQLPGSPSWLRPARRRSPKSCAISAIIRSRSARTISATTWRRCRPRTASKSIRATSITSTRCSRSASWMSIIRRRTRRRCPWPHRARRPRSPASPTIRTLWTRRRRRV